MVKSNKLRRLYLVYSLVLSELFIAVWIICAGFVEDEEIVTVLRILGAAAAVIAPTAMYVFYRWVKKDNQSSSDELEQLMLTKGFAAAGFAAVTLSPVVTLLSFIFSGAAGFIVLGFMAVIGGTLKCAVYYYHRKF
jgi:archaellum biogenesis protein FlaJ (TadC family)